MFGFPQILPTAAGIGGGDGTEVKRTEDGGLVDGGGSGEERGGLSNRVYTESHITVQFWDGHQHENTQEYTKLIEYTPIYSRGDDRNETVATVLNYMAEMSWDESEC